MKNDLITARQQAIYEYVSNRNFSVINEISSALDIKPSTVRRDVKKLEQQRRVVSFHGGVSVDTGYEKYEFRTLKYAELKKKIGHRAAQMVKPHDAIYIGGGSTAYEFARALSARDDLRHVLVVASSVTTAALFFQKNCFTVMIPGGELNTLNESQTSVVALDFVRGFYFKKAFVGTQGIDANVGYTNPMFELNELKKVVIAQSKEVILMCDHSKIGKADAFIACPTSEIDTIVTDQNEKVRPKLEELRAMGTEIIEV